MTFVGTGMLLCGLAIGSFLNVCILRLPKGESIVSPRSRCASCRHALAWYDNIPLFSYAWLKGRCRYCRRNISPQYPLIEAASGLCFVLAFLKFPDDLPAAAMTGLAAAVLLAVSIIDVRHRVIPDALSLPLLVGGL